MGEQLELYAEAGPRLVVVIGCGKSKQSHPAPLRELYTGNLFAARTRYAQQFGGVSIVVSALLHWMDADTVSAPYEMNLSRQPMQFRADWQDVTLEGAMRDTQPGDTVLVLASGLYAGTWCDELADEGRTVLRPLAGMSMGRQLAWLADHTPIRDGGRAVFLDDATGQVQFMRGAARAVRGER
jgi:hypothetical protein